MKAHYFGSFRDKTSIKIIVDHNFTGSGCSVPRLNNFFHGSYCITTIEINIGPLASFKIYYPDNSVFNNPQNPQTCEMLVFRKGCTGINLVNMRKSDDDQMKNVVAL